MISLLRQFRRYPAVDLDEYRSVQRDLGRTYREVIGAHYPAMALVEVKGLVERAARLEIEAMAIVTDS